MRRKEINQFIYSILRSLSLRQGIVLVLFLVVAVAASAGMAGGGRSRSVLLGLLALLLLLGLLLGGWDVVGGVWVVVFFGLRVGDKGFTASGSETAEDWDWAAGFLNGITVAVDVGLDTVGGLRVAVELGRHVDVCRSSL